MTAMDPKAAAEAIRDALKHEPAPEPTAEGRHQLSFLQQVCDHLGLEKTESNAAHVAHLMAKAGIEQHKPDEYPKMLIKQVNRTKDTKGGVVAVEWPDDHPLAGQPVVFHSAEEEAEYHEKYPEAAA